MVYSEQNEIIRSPMYKCNDLLHGNVHSPVESTPSFRSVRCAPPGHSKSHWFHDLLVQFDHGDDWVSCYPWGSRVALFCKGTPLVTGDSIDSFETFSCILFGFPDGQSCLTIGCFLRMGDSQNHRFQYKMVEFWMIWGYPHFRKLPIGFEAQVKVFSHVSFSANLDENKPGSVPPNAYKVGPPSDANFG